jgi:FtsP/CotA-like multicopper oxidase with cupredoxin domain
LNGSNARIYKLAWSDGTPMTVIGADGGLLERPAVRRFMTLAPAQRADLWLDLGGRAVGSRLELRSEAFPVADGGIDMGRGMGMMGRMMGGGRGAGMGGMGAGRLELGAPVSLLSITVARQEQAGAQLAPRLSAFGQDWQPVPAAPIRRIPIAFRAMEWTLGGRTFEMAQVAGDETVRAGSTHIWEFVNEGGPMGMHMAHPIHLHGRQFRVVGRTGGSASNALRDGLIDAGWLDTVLVLPNESVRVQVRFSDHRGLFLYHCHILEHEDMGMMRNFRVV